MRVKLSNSRIARQNRMVEKSIFLAQVWTESCPRSTGLRPPPPKKKGPNSNICLVLTSKFYGSSVYCVPQTPGTMYCHTVSLSEFLIFNTDDCLSVTQTHAQKGQFVVRHCTSTRYLYQILWLGSTPSTYIVLVPGTRYKHSLHWRM